MFNVIADLLGLWSNLSTIIHLREGNALTNGQYKIKLIINLMNDHCVQEHSTYNTLKKNHYNMYKTVPAEVK